MGIIVSKSMGLIKIKSKPSVSIAVLALELINYESLFLSCWIENKISIIVIY